MHIADNVVKYGLLAAIALANVVFSQTYPAPPCDRTIAEEGLRKTFATKIVHPTYPKDAILAKVTGVAVAELCVPAGSKGAPIIRIATAPSAAIAKSLEQALSQWRFGPMWRQGAPSEFLSYASKVIYYFVQRDGQWVVLSSDDSFYVGPKFALQQQTSHY